MNKAVDVLKVRVGLPAKFPNPAAIDSTGEWYFLDHVSSGLVHFDHNKGKFEGLLAENWVSHPSGAHTFTLRADAKFHDGTPITASDVEASIKQLLIKRSSTHFPLWDYIEDCDKITSVADPCAGIKAITEHSIELRLKMKVESFYLQLASPETGIWWKQDLLSSATEFKPTKFSGPYYVEKYEDKLAVVKRNNLNPISQKFLDSPREIQFITNPSDKANQALIDGALDVVVRIHNPLGEPDWNSKGISIFESSPSTIVFLRGSDQKGQDLVGRDLLEKMWEKPLGDEVFAAETFLPFNRGYSLTREDLLSQLPKKTKKHIKVAVPWNYFCDRFQDVMTNAGREIGTEIELLRLDKLEWYNAVNRVGDMSHFDYVLIPYAASERYPAVQLRYITGQTLESPIDLKKGESPDLGEEKVKVLRDYQRWLTKNQHVVPLFFLRSQIAYSSKLDVGDQPPNDAEVELWRVTKK